MSDSIEGKKSPAFQFYASDFIGSSKVQRMPLAERGAYITLLSFAWLDEGLPTDMGELGRMVGLGRAAFVKMWNSQLHKCFVERSGKFVNLRQEDIRKAQAEYRKRQRDNAAKGWQSRGNAVASERHMPNACSPSPTPSLSPKEQEISSATSAEPYPVLDFPVNGKPSTWGLTQAQVDEWAALYPGIDIMAECRKAKAWLVANRRKTAGGMPRFLVNWLNTANDRRPRFANVGIQSVDGPSLEMRRNAEKYADLNGTPTRKVGAA